jgi:hypothetical protein
MPRRTVSVGAVLFAIALGTIASAYPSTASAFLRCNRFRVSPSKLHIEATLGVESTYTASVRLTEGRITGSHAPYFLPAGDLREVGSTMRRIDEDQVSIANPGSPLDAHESRDLVLSLKGLRFAGAYEGALLLARGNCRIPLTVAVAGAAEVSLVGAENKPLALQALNCGGWVCGPSNLMAKLSPAVTRREEFAPQIANDSQSSVRVIRVHVALSRDPGGEAVQRRALVASSTKPYSLPPQSVSRLQSIHIERRDIEPGHYVGAIYLTVLGADKPVSLPLELDAKVGPSYAIGALIMALFVQLLLGLAASNKERRTELSEQRRLRREVRELPSGDSVLLKKPLKDARQLALDGKVAEAEAVRKKVEDSIASLKEVHEVVTEVKGSQSDGMPDPMGHKVVVFRHAVESGDTTAAASAKSQIESESSRLPATDAGGSASSVTTREHWSTRFLQAATGLVARFEIYVLPGMLRGILVLAFLLAGLKELYLDNSTFGASWMLDYSGVFLWGLTGSGLNALLGKVIPSLASI